MFKLIATDMDGTFLRDDMTYDRDLFATLHEKMQAQGIQWVVASGNQYFQLTSFFEAFPDTIYVAENGAYIRDANKVYALSSFENGAIQPILTKLTSIPDLKILVCGQSSAYALKTTDADHIATARQYYKQLRLVVLQKKPRLLLPKCANCWLAWENRQAAATATLISFNPG